MSKKRKNIACEKANRGSNAKIAAAAVTGLLLTVVPAVGCAGSANKGEDPFGYRAEFVNLVRLAKSAASVERQRP